MNDVELLAAGRAGDTSAGETLVARNFDSAYRFFITNADEFLVALALWHRETDKGANAERAVAAAETMEAAGLPLPAWVSTSVQALR